MDEYNFEVMSPERLLTTIDFIRLDKPNSLFLIVEGDSDFKFFEHYVENDIFILTAEYLELQTAGNKDKVIETIQMANEEGYVGIIGVIDSDFDNLIGFSSDDNLYRTDTHDLESLLLKSERAFKKVLTSYFPAKRITPSDVLEVQMTLLNLAKYIGYALWCSNENRWMLQFKNFPIHECIDDDCELLTNDMFQKLIDLSDDTSISLEFMRQEIENKMSLNHDLWQVCRGKDMLKILARYLKYSLGKGNYNSETLSKEFRLSFDKDDFINTNLYNHIKEFERYNGGYSLINF